MKLQAVIFDLGSVIASNEWPLVFEKIASKTDEDKQRIEEIIGPLFKKWCANTISEDDLWQSFERQTDTALSPEFTNDFFVNTYKMWSEDVAGTWDVIHELHQKTIRMALLSDTVHVHVQANEEMGRFPRLRRLGFEAFVYSFEEECVKPDPRIYNAALDNLELSAEACVMVDDKLKAVEGAQEVGMSGIHFTSPTQLRTELVRMNIL